MTSPPGNSLDPDGPVTYQIRIKGHLEPTWAQWFDGMTITLDPEGDTTLVGPVVDQSALHGLLRKIRDLGLPLQSVRSLEAVGNEESFTPREDFP